MDTNFVKSLTKIEMKHERYKKLELRFVDGGGKYRVLLKPLPCVMNDVPGPATLYEDIPQANEIIKSFVGRVHTCASARAARLALAICIPEFTRRAIHKRT